MRNGDVTVPVGQVELAKVFGVRNVLDAFVIDSYFLEHLDVVPDHHLATAYYRGAPDLVGVQPADMDRRPHSVGVYEVNKCDILDAGLDVGATAGRRGNR